MDQSKVDPNFTTYFNTPKIRTKFTLGSTEISDAILHSMFLLRYHNSYYWDSTFLNGQIPATWTFDAAMNFDDQELNSKVKIGAFWFYRKRLHDVAWFME